MNTRNYTRFWWKKQKYLHVNCCGDKRQLQEEKKRENQEQRLFPLTLSADMCWEWHIPHRRVAGRGVAAGWGLQTRQQHAPKSQAAAHQAILLVGSAACIWFMTNPSLNLSLMAGMYNSKHFLFCCVLLPSLRPSTPTPTPTPPHTNISLALLICCMCRCLQAHRENETCMF